MARPVIWFEIYVSELERSVEFYQRLAGWEFEPLDGMPKDSYRQIANTDTGDIGGAIVSGFPERCGTSGTVLYLHVDSFADSIEVLRSAGGRLETDEQPINGSDGRFVLARDPAENLIGLWTA